MAGRWQRIHDVMLSKAASCVAVGLGAIIVLGCMNISFGGKHGVCVPVVEESTTFEQVGKIPIRTGNDPVIYYAVPYASPPNLEIEDPSGLCEIMEQKETYFKVHFHANVTSSPNYLTWKARGTRPGQLTVTPNVPVVETAPPTVDVPTAVLVPPAAPKS